MSSAAPLGAADIERFHDKTRGNINFLQMYGLTEASPLILCQSKTLNGGIKIGGSGMLVPNTKAKIVDIDDPNNKNLGPNKSGELIISGPQIMKGYYKNVESTRATIVDDGWLRTGDIAHYDEDGQFYITDRLKELIKVIYLNFHKVATNLTIFLYYFCYLHFNYVNIYYHILYLILIHP